MNFHKGYRGNNWRMFAPAGVATLFGCPDQAVAASGISAALPEYVSLFVCLLITGIAAWLYMRSSARRRPRRFEDLYEIMVEHMQDGLYMIEGEHYVYVNPAFASLIGYEVEELTGQSFRDVIAPSTLSLVEDYHRRRRAGENVPSRYEARYLHKNGVTEIPVILNIDLVTLRDGRVVSVGTVTDISERVQIEEALRASEKQLSEAQRLGRIGHWQVNPKTHEVECSDMFCEIYGWDRENITPTLGRVISSIHPEDRERINALRSAAVLNREPYECVFRAIRPDGEIRVIRGEGQPEFDEKGRFKSLFGVSQDITEQKQIEEELIRERIRAEDANSAKSEFLATISHEIRTPLNAILGFAEIMDEEVLGPLGNTKYIEYVSDIRDSARHLLDLVGDLLDISAIEAGEFSLSPADIKLDEMVQECLSVVRVQARNAKVTLTAQVPENLPALHADRRAVKQVLINLLTNAIKFTPEGGHVAISTSIDGTAFHVKVADTGVGIPKDVLPDIILPFERGRQNPHEAKDGTGLGLAIVNSLVAMHGGSLEIESDVGNGTVVHVSFPVDNRAAV